MYNFPLNNSFSTFEILKAADEIYDRQNNAFRLNVEFGLILFHTLTCPWWCPLPQQLQTHNRHDKLASLKSFHQFCEWMRQIWWSDVLWQTPRHSGQDGRNTYPCRQEDPEQVSWPKKSNSTPQKWLAATSELNLTHKCFWEKNYVQLLVNNYNQISYSLTFARNNLGNF